MGRSNIDELSRTLLTAGFAASLPVAVVQNVSSAAQRPLFTTLAELAQKVKAHDMGSPSVLVLGQAVSLPQRAGLDADQLPRDRNRVVSGERVYIRVDLGGRAVSKNIL